MGLTKLALLLLVIDLARGTDTCTFPGYLQNNVSDSNDYWQASPKMGEGGTFYKFHKSKMIYGDIIDNKLNTRQTWTCKAVTEDAAPNHPKYLVEESYDLPDKCVQFLKRSDSVFQLGTATPYKCDCREHYINMTVDNAPFIAKKEARAKWTPFDIQGGFNASVTQFQGYGKGKVICEDKTTMVESECLDGEGVWLEFPSLQCVPETTGWRPSEKLYSIARWNDSDYTYHILTTPSPNYRPSWCARHSKTTAGDATIELDIFQDLVCPNNIDLVPLNLTYIKFDLTRKANSTKFIQTEPCKFTEDKLVGNYKYRADDTDNTDVDVTESQLTVQGFANFSCMSSPDKWFYETRATPATPRPGCRQRYACVNLQRVNENILLGRIGKSEVFYIDIKCNKYQDDPAPVRDEFRSSHHKVFTATTPRTVTNASLNYTRPLKGTNVTSGIICSGNYDGCRKDGNIQFKMDKCTASEELSGIYSPLGNIPSDTNLNLLITKRADDVRNCWLLEGDEYFKLPSPQCHGSTRLNIKTGKRIPLARYRSNGAMTPCPTPAPSTTTTTTEKPTTTPTPKPTTEAPSPPSTAAETTAVTEGPSTVNTTVEFTTSSNSTGNPSHHTGGLAPATLAGAVVGILVGIVAVCLVMYLWCRHLRKTGRNPYDTLRIGERRRPQMDIARAEPT